MKKTLVVLLIVLSMFFIACSNSEKAKNDKLNVIATTFPIYDWSREVLGERLGDVNLTILVDSGVDLHSFQPSIQDVTEISTADMFMYIGGPSDLWVHDALAQKQNEDMIVVNMMDILGDEVLMEELIEGMTETEHAHDHDEHNHDEHNHDEHNHDEHNHDEHNHDEHESHAHEEHEEADEHVWLSLKNAEFFVMEIAYAFGELDPEFSEVYEENARAYISKLHALDEEYEVAVTNAHQKTLLVADRFPFAYLVDDYSLSYHAAFVGCSAETEASFETIAFLSNKVDELGLRNIIVIDGTTHQIPQTIVGNTVSKNQNIVLLDAMQSTAKADIDAGATYLGIMEKNLEALKTVLAN